MTTARQIITGTLRFGLNRLSPGETLDADLADVCLEALNSLIDEVNGDSTQLWRQTVISGAVSGVSGTLGTTWAGLVAGESILSATYNDGAQDLPLEELTFAQYQAIPIKATSGQPQYWAYDGHLTVYFYPAPSGQTVKLRTTVAASDFADLDTDYVMPKGRKAAYQALLAEKLAPVVVGEVSPAVARAARQARLTMKSSMAPEIIGARSTGNILSGWR